MLLSDSENVLMSKFKIVSYWADEYLVLLEDNVSHLGNGCSILLNSFSRSGLGATRDTVSLSPLDKSTSKKGLLRENEKGGDSTGECILKQLNIDKKNFLWPARPQIFLSFIFSLLSLSLSL